MVTPEPNLSDVAAVMDRYYRAAIDRIRQAIRESGRTEEEIAERAGLSQGYINKIKRGKQVPHGAALFKLIGAIGIDLAELSVERLLGVTVSPTSEP